MGYREIREAIDQAFISGASTYTCDGHNYERICRYMAQDWRREHPNVEVELTEDFLTGAIFSQYTNLTSTLYERQKG